MKVLKRTDCNLIAWKLKTNVKRHVYTDKVSARNRAVGIVQAGRKMGRIMSMSRIDENHYTVVALSDADKTNFMI